MKRKKQYYAYFFILPGCLILLMFTIMAAVLAFGFSFMDFNLLRPQDIRFIGFSNYIRLFQDNSFLKALKNTLYFAAVVVPYQVTLAFCLALLVKENIKGIGIFRSAYFSPLVTSMSVIAILWTFIYNPNPTQGLLNAILTKMGLPSCDFLRSADTAMNSIIPGIKNVLVFVVMMTTIAAMKLFTQPYIMTNGGPKESTMTLTYYLYRQGFQYRNMGYASAISVLFFVLVVGISVIVKKLMKAR